jgi:hypothetical protein
MSQHRRDTIGRRRGDFLLLFACLAAALVLLSFACGGKDGKKAPDPKPDEPKTEGDDGKTPEQKQEGLRPGEVKEEDPAGGAKSSILPGVRRRLVSLTKGLQDSIFLNDPGGFEKSFWDVDSLKSIIVSMKDKAAWRAMLKKAGENADDIEFEKYYKKTLRALFDDLLAPGGKCGLSAEQRQAVARSGKPARMLFADTFKSAGERSRVIVLCGFFGSDRLEGIMRIRAMPHKNRRHWYYMGDERIDAVQAIAEGEAARVTESLTSLVEAQKAFMASKKLDRDDDGKGEYAFLNELAGTWQLRGSTDPMKPVLAGPFLEVSENGMVLSGTHLFRIFLPGQDEPAFRDRGALEPAPLTDARESGWCALAWPAAKGCGTGLYFVGPSGAVLRAKNPSPHVGLGGPPPAAAGFKGEAAGWGTPLDGPGTSLGGIEWEASR